MPSKKNAADDRPRQPRVRIAAKKHTHAGREGYLTGETATPPGSTAPMLKVVWSEGGQEGCYAEQQDLIYLDLPAGAPAPAKGKKKQALRGCTPGPVGDTPIEDARPMRQPGQQLTTRAGRKKLPTCGAETGDGTPCQNPAGHATDHPGEGRCKFHGGVGQVKGTRHELGTGRYSDLQVRPRLRELVAKYQGEADLTDLSPELVLLRALVQDFVERHDSITEALLAWHASYTKDFEEDLNLWRGEVAAYVEATEERGEEPREPFPTPPYPGAYVKKPRQMTDIATASGLIDRIGAMADRIEKRKQTGTISTAVFALVLEELAIELVNACEEVGIRDVLRTRLLTSVDRRWRDARSIPRDALLAAGGVSEGPATLH